MLTQCNMLTQTNISSYPSNSCTTVQNIRLSLSQRCCSGSAMLLGEQFLIFCSKVVPSYLRDLRNVRSPTQPRQRHIPEDLHPLDIQSTTDVKTRHQARRLAIPQYDSFALTQSATQSWQYGSDVRLSPYTLLFCLLVDKPGRWRNMSVKTQIWNYKKTRKARTDRRTFRGVRVYHTCDTAVHHTCTSTLFLNLCETAARLILFS